MRELYGLLGRRISYSRSPEIHQALWQEKDDALIGSEYVLFDTDDLKSFVNYAKSLKHLRGFNVTIPYKESILAYLDEIDEDASIIGAVNTVKCMPDGGWIGYNTDVTGFEETIRGLDLCSPIQVFILGTGGASKAVARAFEKRSIPFTYVSRHPQGAHIGYDTMEMRLNPSIPQLIVNTTPLGSAQYPSQSPPIPYDLLSSRTLLIDLIYVPEDTSFMQEGRKFGARTFNGLTMLWAQARAAQKIWSK